MSCVVLGPVVVLWQAGGFFFSAQTDASIQQSEREFQEATAASSSEDSMDKPLLLEQVSRRTGNWAAQRIHIQMHGAPLYSMTVKSFQSIR